MNNTEEFNKLLEQAYNIPYTFTEVNVRKRVRKKVIIHRTMIAVKSTFALVFLLCLSVIVGVNTSESFASKIEGIPLLSSIADQFTLNKGVGDALDAGYLTKIGLIAEGDISDVELSYAVADDDYLIMYFKVFDEDISGSIDLKNINGKANTEFTYSLGCIGDGFSDEFDGYTYMMINWEQFSKDVDVKLILKEASGQKEELSYQFSLEKKLEPKVYEIDKDYDIDGYKFNIKRVSVSPLTTLVEVEYGEQEPFYMNFSISSKDGKLRRNVKSFIDKFENNEEKNSITYVLEGIYFTESEDLILTLDSLQYQTEGLKEVYFDTKDRLFYEADGRVASDIHITDEGGYYKLTIDRSNEWAYHNGLVGKNGPKLMGNISTEDEIAWLFDPSEYEARDNRIYFERCYPDVIIYPDCSLELK